MKLQTLNPERRALLVMADGYDPNAVGQTR